MENNIYTLMNKNQPILDFEYDQEIHAIKKIDKIYPEGEKYASLGIMNYKQEITR